MSTPNLPALDDDEPVHTWFELSYSNYTVLHRTLLQSMPVPWQRRFVACLEELGDAFAHVEQAPGYEVTPCRWLAPADMDAEQLRRAQVSVDLTQPRYPTYYDRFGNEIDRDHGRVALPVREPVPHYDRGRARVQMAGAS